MRICENQENCQYFTTGDNKPPNHDVRKTVKCKLFFNGECYNLQGQSCNLKKVRRLKNDGRR